MAYFVSNIWARDLKKKKKKKKEATSMFFYKKQSLHFCFNFKSMKGYLSCIISALYK